ncbi:L-dopachrome tautomerase-related protein [Sphingomonas sp. S-NIH.Pt15_0812]|uniref:L-dopachrome tautomerase-related protein n=1 Tax=Sphingomonas sp. S-NIH.Pt15_0812 TaxID=1920129 RepID=UPI000F7F1FC7|nr:L-dopachrome tautomerase-related protein [Sphingomonas sp. S-NIH.Pt15_0812]RSU45332.1 alpha/beta hydrolase [Sphingomonas sp. S-NIH.Pt15_0812]
MPMITTGDLNMEVSLYGAKEGQPLLLIHGWPDDASTWDQVAPALAAEGFCVVVPTLRGFGATRFLNDDALRTGNSAMLATDMIALLDTLGIDRFMVAGHDWGSNTAEALAVGWPDRVERMAMLSTPPRLGGMPTPPFEQTQRQWYHWFMATARGAEAVHADRRGFTHLHWVNWSPPGWFDEVTFDRVARSFDNPDWADVTLHSYRARWGEAEADPRSAWLEDKVKATTTLSLPTLYIHGDADGVNPPSTAQHVPAKFAGPFARITMTAVGHFPQRENPQAVVRHLLTLFAGAPAALTDTIDRSLTMKKAAPYAAGIAAIGLVAAAAAGVAHAQGRSAQLTQVAQFDHQATGVAVTEDGRRFVNFPRWTDDVPISVAEVMKDGSLRPYPDAKWNSWRNARANELPVGDYFVCVQSIVPDGHGNLWVLDPGAPGNEKILEGAPKLVRIDLASNTVTKTILVPGDVALQGTYLNDIRFSPDGKTGYITDSGTRGAIIVVDLESGKSHRALDGHPSTQIDKTVKVTLDGKPLVRPDGRQPAFAADGIAISKDGKTLYYQALTGKTLYAIDTAKLRSDISEADRAAAVKTVAQTHVADGLWMSKAGVLYLTSPTDYAIKRLNGTTVETVLTDRRLRWPDTFSEGRDGTMYVTASHIQDTNWFTPGAPPSIKTQLFSFPPAK